MELRLPLSASPAHSPLRKYSGVNWPLGAKRGSAPARYLERSAIVVPAVMISAIPSICQIFSACPQ